MPTFNEHVKKLQLGFDKLCESPNGQPDKREVQALLDRAGKALNERGYEEAQANFAEHAGHNPWHICFAMALVWGHLANPNPAFIGAAVRYLRDEKHEDLAIALRAHNERGPELISGSLRGARQTFSLANMPATLPQTLSEMGAAQKGRWWRPLSQRNRPQYMGSWNATGMFKMALFQNPDLAAHLRDDTVYLPSGGPLDAGLRKLYGCGLLSEPPPARGEDSFDPLAITASNRLLLEIHSGWDGWSLLDTHSGVYMLGCRLPAP